MRNRAIRGLAILLTAWCLGALAPAAWPEEPGLHLASCPQTSAVTVTTTTETVACTLTVPFVDASETVHLWGVAQVTTGLGTTSLTVRLRRGTTTSGTLVGVATTVQVTAGNTVAVTIAGEDSPGSAANQGYVLTVAQTAATGNGSIVSSEILALNF